MPAKFAITALKTAIAEEAGDRDATKAALESISLTLLENDLRRSEPVVAMLGAWQDSVIKRVANARLGIWPLNKRMSRHSQPPESPVMDHGAWHDTAAL